MDNTVGVGRDTSSVWGRETIIPRGAFKFALVRDTECDPLPYSRPTRFNRMGWNSTTGRQRVGPHTTPVQAVHSCEERPFRRTLHHLSHGARKGVVKLECASAIVQSCLQRAKQQHLCAQSFSVCH